MSRINHLILADGRSIDVSGNGIDHTEFTDAVRAHRATASKVMAFNLYNASSAPFCLGSHPHTSAAEAQRKASRDNYFSSFEVKYNSGNRTMELVGGNAAGVSQTRFALFNGSTFKKPAYESAYDARRASTSGDIVVEIGVRGTKVVSVRVVS